LRGECARAPPRRAGVVLMADYQLYLIRHGVAEDRGEAWPDDAKRPLTARGANRLRKAMRGVARLNVSIDVILTSPLVRTRQTSDIVASVFDPRPPIVAIESLAPGGSYPSVVADIEKHSRRSNIALVGHEPGIGEIAAHLAGLRHRLEFKKGAICRIEMEGLGQQFTGRLQWFLTPRIMRALRR
jgi:phosphohistidine phosphatase